MIDKSIPPGKWWRIIKSVSKLNKQYKPLPPLKSNGKIIFHPVEKATVLNKYFAQVSSITSEPDIPLHGPGPPSDVYEGLSNLLITEDEVYDQLSIINNTKPPGPDNLSPRILKSISTSIKKTFSQTFQFITESETITKYLEASSYHTCFQK